MSSKKDKWYQQTESLLYTYKSFPIRIMALMRQIEIVREQLMPTMTAAYEAREGAVYTVSSPVETAVINRLEGDTIQKIEQKIKNLESLKEIVEVSVDTMLEKDQKRLMEMIYIENKPWQQVCQGLNVDKNTYYQRKNEIVKVLAWCFGYLPDEEAEEVLGLFMEQTLWQKCREKSGNKSGKKKENFGNKSAVL